MADPEVLRQPAVLLVHYRGGLQGSTLEDAQMIAKLGYVVFAEDIFGKDVIRKSLEADASRRSDLQHEA